MKTVNKVLLTIIAMLAVILLALGINRTVENVQEARWEKERTVRLEEVSASSEEIRSQIEEISQLSKEEIEAYINENVYVEEDESTLPDTEISDPWEQADPGEDDTLPEDEDISRSMENTGDDADGDLRVHDDGINDTEENDDNTLVRIDDNIKADGSVSDNTIDDTEDASVSDNDIYGESVSDNSVSEDSVSENSLSSDGTVSGNSIITLKERQTIRSSYDETRLWIEADNKILEDMEQDFSELKIACLGDSITEAANLSDMEDYKQYSYPTRLYELFDADKVTNLGIGGSSLGRYWDQAFCDRYEDIPEDTDLILVMGGTNDGFCLTEDLVGDIEERKPRTLYGDVNDLMSGLKENYPDAEVIFLTPMPNLLHDVLRKERDYLLPQTVVVDCIRELADEYDYELIDLYNSNFFDSHDADIVSSYIPDSVHPNIDGYSVLARHVAAEILRLHEEKEKTGTEDTEDMSKEDDLSEDNTDEENGIEEEDSSQDTGNTAFSRDDYDETSDSEKEEATGSEEKSGISPKEDETDTDTGSRERIVYARDE